MSAETAALVAQEREHLATTADVPSVLFGTTDPAEVVARATEVASVLADVVKRQDLVTKIGRSEHLNIEAWTLLGSMLGVYANVDRSEPIPGGWQAHAITRYRGHTALTEADGMCTTDEDNWRKAEPHAIRSMAQTRACSKALSLALRWVVSLAGYSGTPAEEMAGAAEPTPTGNRVPRSRAKSSRPPSNESLRAEVVGLAEERGLDREALTALAESVGVRAGTPATKEQLETMRRHLVRLPTPETMPDDSPDPNPDAPDIAPGQESFGY